MRQVSYSLGAYILAVLARSSKTVLVEGLSDIVVLSGFKLAMERATSTAVKVVIDDVSLVNDVSLSGLGNRERVRAVAQSFSAIPKFSALIDREWDGFDWEDPSNYMAAALRDETARTWWTKGHSIENYLFDLLPIQDILARKYAEHMSQALLERLQAALGNALELAFCFSWAAKKAAVIERSAGIVTRTCINRSVDGRLEFNFDELERIYSARGVLPVAWAIFRAEYDRAFQLCARGAVSLEHCKWLAHGHLGERIIWVCLSFIMQENGCPDEICAQIETGMKDDKLRAGVHFLVGTDQCFKAPLGEVIEWGAT